MAGDPRALLQKADKALSGASGGFSFFGSRDDKYQAAADLYIQAGNAFKMQKSNRESGQAFEKAAGIMINNLKEPDDAANTMVDAYKAYKLDSPEDAARCLDYSISQYCSKGNFRRAAQNKEYQGELYETQLGDLKRALSSYEEAAGWYEGDGANALANKLWLKVADIAALEGDYDKAVENYERVANISVSNNLMKYSVKDYFLKASVCHLAARDTVAAQRALEKYGDMDPTFLSTREYQLIVDLIGTIEEGDQDKFADKLFAYDQMNKLDKWKTALFLRVKETIEEDDNEFA